MNRFKYKKAVQAFNLFATKNGGSMYRIKAVKLLWLADRLHLRKYGRTITSDEYFALAKGPIATKSKDLLLIESATDSISSYVLSYLKRSDYSYYALESPDLSVFSESDVRVLEEIYNEFGNVDRFALVELSHKYPEWKKYEEALKSSGKRSHKMDLNDFFLNPGEGNDPIFSEDEELLELSKEHFKERGL